MNVSKIANNYVQSVRREIEFEPGYQSMMKHLFDLAILNDR